ncbi:MAG: DUF6485 family protein [Candidatus Hydrogenedens sp.]
MEQKCKNQEHNQSFCSCSYPGCPRHAVCCECLQYHLKKRQLPGCCFPPDAEKTYDRSFEAFARAWGLSK